MNNNYPTLKKQIQALGSWQNKYRQLMQYAKNLPELATEMKVDNALVTGCESNVWLYKDFAEDEGTLVFSADSDTRIVKGLLYLILTMVNGLTPSEVVDFDIEHEFEALGLTKQLSQSRGNGIRAIAKEIHDFAKSQ